ncbi:hypothetical protein AG1IA_08359 [Rhizoctonia solani AG-1 IA]|uniref:Uncharacterized protein n=1 Tax=Thanatephorus cucumeris (strain AG1-IA) TaxID=983506 RepID=L8WMN3_THACA|nr:hypothetical protein AG1IA_08359 [Rhizoctonia solani AG-1 IA]
MQQRPSGDGSGKSKRSEFGGNHLQLKYTPLTNFVAEGYVLACESIWELAKTRMGQVDYLGLSESSPDTPLCEDWVHLRRSNINLTWCGLPSQAKGPVIQMEMMDGETSRSCLGNRDIMLFGQLPSVMGFLQSEAQSSRRRMETYQRCMFLDDTDATVRSKSATISGSLARSIPHTKFRPIMTETLGSVGGPGHGPSNTQYCCHGIDVPQFSEPHLELIGSFAPGLSRPILQAPGS